MNIMQKGLQVIVGLGKTGLSCLHYLVQQNCAIAITDSRENPPGLAEIQVNFPHIPLYLGQLDAHLCTQASQLIMSPGVSLQEPAIAHAIAQGIPAIGDIELFADATSAPVIAITGSNGKSTVTSLVGEMAKAAGLHVAVGGNLGTPALDLLTPEPAELYVLELSSFQLETTFSLAPIAATVLNLCEDHMDRYENAADYLRAKQRIYRHCATAIINRDDPITWQNLSLNSPLSFGLDAPLPGHFGLLQHQQQWYLAQGNECLLPTTALNIKGRHQIANALAALALGYAANLPMAAMLTALQSFPGLPHRCQWIACYHGVDWYNDSKATNVGAAQAALQGLGAEISGKLIVIAGGIGKNADFSPLRLTLQKYAKLLILIGQDAPIMTAALDQSVPIQQAVTLQDAVAIAYEVASAGDAVILAPACASFDMFHHFEHRGNVFMDAVRELA